LALYGRILLGHIRYSIEYSSSKLLDSASPKVVFCLYWSELVCEVPNRSARKELIMEEQLLS